MIDSKPSDARMKRTRQVRGEAAEVAEIDWAVLAPRLGRSLYIELERRDPSNVPTDENGNAEWEALDASEQAGLKNCALGVVREFLAQRGLRLVDGRLVDRRA